MVQEFPRGFEALCQECRTKTESIFFFFKFEHNLPTHRRFQSLVVLARIQRVAGAGGFTGGAAQRTGGGWLSKESMWKTGSEIIGT